MSKDYENTEVRHLSGGGKIVRKVSIKNGMGYKSVSKYNKGRKVGTAKKPIHKSHINLILVGKFVPGLFANCKCNNKTRKQSRK